MRLELRNMSREEKLIIMHEIWEELAREDGELASPEWHRAALEETEGRLREGKERVHEWEAAKAELRRRASG